MLRNPNSLHASQIGDHVTNVTRSAIDAVVFGVVRELLSNVVQHSRARTAAMALRPE
ncbi:hypothetical protein MAHJHV63_50620 [Mycobacterium avium subsp. hominissuis]